MIYNGISNSSITRSHVTYPYAWWDNLFTPEELELLAKYFDGKGAEYGTVGKDYAVDKKTRVSKIKMYNLDNENTWIFNKFNQAIMQINSNFYGYDLNGYEMIQYGEYHAKDKGHYDWHMDMQLGERQLEDILETRKLSLTFLLNEPGVDFEGGELEIAPSIQTAMPVETQKGRIIAFPSWINHRVKPVTKGIRKSLVIWVCGPKFK